jgi:hypothetical protein
MRYRPGSRDRGGCAGPAFAARRELLRGSRRERHGGRHRSRAFRHGRAGASPGGNGDGLGCHSAGGGNLLSGCAVTAALAAGLDRAYWNSDDGLDFIRASATCTIDRSFAFNNGFVPDTTTPAGNGVGFKAGGYGLDTTTFPATVPRHVVRMNVAFGNRAQGFYANHHPGGIDFFNNTAFDNPTNFNMLGDVGASSHVLRNNLAMAPGRALSNLSGGSTGHLQLLDAPRDRDRR